jgi:nucleotide-binding universal stress UspA family protein
MIKRILVPVDGGKLSDKAIQAGIALAAQLGAAIVGFAVEPTSRAFWRQDAHGSEGHDDGDAGEVPATSPRLALVQFEQCAREAGVPYEGLCHRASRVDRAIIAAAEALGCDLILMVTEGRGPFGEFLFGSQTKAVLAGCRLPLLIVK